MKKIITCLLITAAFIGCADPGPGGDPIGDDVRDYMSPDLPREEQAVISDVLSSLPSDLRSAESLVYADPKGKLHSNKTEIVNEINQGLITRSAVDSSLPIPRMGLDPLKKVAPQVTPRGSQVYGCISDYGAFYRQITSANLGNNDGFTSEVVFPSISYTLNKPTRQDLAYLLFGGWGGNIANNNLGLGLDMGFVYSSSFNAWTLYIQYRDAQDRVYQEQLTTPRLRVPPLTRATVRFYVDRARSVANRSIISISVRTVGASQDRLVYAFPSDYLPNGATSSFSPLAGWNHPKSAGNTFGQPFLRFKRMLAIAQSKPDPYVPYNPNDPKTWDTYPSGASTTGGYFGAAQVRYSSSYLQNDYSEQFTVFQPTVDGNHLCSKPTLYIKQTPSPINGVGNVQIQLTNP